MEQYPDSPDAYSILYLVSSALPSHWQEWVRHAKRIGARVVLNQNGVAYPGWAGKQTRRINDELRGALEAADFILYQSRFSRDSCDRFLSVAKCPHEVLTNCVNTAEFHPGPDRDADVWRLVSTGSHHEPYRLLSALASVAILKRRGRPVTFRIAGRIAWPGGEHHVREVAAELNVDGHIEITGPYSQSEAPSIYRSVHILLHPKYKDPCPTVVLEAMACGVPVVGSASGGMPELVGNDGGLLLPVPDDWNALHAPEAEAVADAVEAVMDDWPSWSVGARARAANLFSLPHWLNTHTRVFTALTGVS